MSEREQLLLYRKAIAKYSEEEKIEHDLYLRNFAIGELQGPQTGFASLDKPWLKWYNPELFSEKVGDCNNYDFFIKSTEKMNNPKLICFYGKTYYRDDILKEVEKYIQKFNSMGIKENDTVSFIMLNVPEAIFMWLALSKMGVISNMIKFDESHERIKFMTEITKSKYIFVSNVPFMVENVSKSFEENTSLEKAILIDLPESLSIGQKIKMIMDQTSITSKINLSKKQNKSISLEYAKTLNSLITSFSNMEKETKKIILSNQKLVSYKDWMSEDKAFGNKNVILGGGNKVSAIVYTGGTTGQPKGVQLTNDNINAMVSIIRSSEVGFDFGKKSMSILPPGIAYYFNAIYCHMCLGLTIDLISNFTIEEYPYLIKKYEPNIFLAGPILFDEMMKANILKNGNFIETPISGGDKLHKEEEVDFDNYLAKVNSNAVVNQGYGMTESTAAATFAKKSTYKLGSVGVPLLGISIGIFDYENQNIEKGCNEIGEVCITGPTLMKGYLANDTATKSVLRVHEDGIVWLHTDDLGYLDEDGRLFHCGRAKRMITRSGNKVWLSDIEEIVLSNKYIESCSCVKKNDDIEREVPVVHFVLKSTPDNIQALVNELNQQIEKQTNIHHVPKYYILRKELPYSEASKKCDIKKLEKEDLFNTDEFNVQGNIIYQKNPESILKRSLTNC